MYYAGESSFQFDLIGYTKLRDDYTLECPKETWFLVKILQIVVCSNSFLNFTCVVYTVITVLHVPQ